MPTLLPFRQYNENDVVNLFKWGGTIPVNKGTLVKITQSGWTTDHTDLAMIGNPGIDVVNTVSQRWGVQPQLLPATSGDAVLGMLLYDVRETDENGEKLIYNPRKAVEMECAVTGQAVPVVVRGTFLYSGDGNNLNGVTPGDTLYCSGAGGIVRGVGTYLAALGTAAPIIPVGKALGVRDTKGYILIRLDV